MATNCRPPDQTSIFLFSSDGRHAVGTITEQENCVDMLLYVYIYVIKIWHRACARTVKGAETEFPAGVLFVTDGGGGRFRVRADCHITAC